MRLRLLLAIGFAAGIGTLHLSGLCEGLDPAKVQAFIRGAGAWGGLAFVVAHACLQPLGVRSVFFVLSAPLIWSPAHAIILSWIGAFVASVLAFGFARYVARDWAQARATGRVSKLDDRLAQDGFRTVAFLRLLFYTTPALQVALGVSRVRFAPFALGTGIGIVPFTVLMTLFGAQITALF